MAHLLWRIEGTCDTPNQVGWEQGLILHLLFQPLTVVMARRDGRTRRYLALAGCPSCRPDGCDRVCHRTLFTQLLRTTLPGVTLTPITRLVPHASETRRLAATPAQADARPLDPAFLEPWADGRLIITWSRLRATPMPVSVGALLAVSGQGPDPAQALRAQGWAPSALGALLARTAFQAPLPPQVHHSVRAGEALLQAIRDPRTLIGAPSLVAPSES